MIYYLIHVLNLVAIYGILAVSLNLVLGYTGILSLAHAAFMGIGAYATAILLTYHGYNFFSTLLVGMVIAGFISWGLARVTLRLKGDYYVIASFGFQIIMYNIFLNCVDLTRGPYGVSHIPAPQVLGYSFQGRGEYLLLTLGFLALCLWIARRLGESPYGKVLRAIREDEVAVASIGKNVNRYKIAIFIVGAILASVGGAFYACLITYVDPYTFTVHESIFILALVIIGGSGNVYGSVLGAALLISFPEVLRFFNIPVTAASPLREIFYGALMILFLRFRPKGLLPERINMGVKHS
jgi:branched-chain amino acid transport system permease protein